MFLFMPSHVRQGFVGLSNRGTARSYTMLGLNLLSQLVCVSGVNQLSSVRDNLLISSLATLAPTATRWHGACLRNCVQLTFFFPFVLFVVHSESIGRIDAGRPHGTQGN